MLLLKNNCRCSGKPANPKKRVPDELPVFPKNWKSSTAPLKKPWYIKYRFYDDNIKKEKQVVIKEGINHFQTANERQQMIRIMMQNELLEIRDKGFNPITGKYFHQGDDDISEFTPFADALKFAYRRVKISDGSKAILRGVLKHTIVAARHKEYSRLPVSQISLKHFVFLFEKIGQIKTAKFKKQKAKGIKVNGEPWSASTINSYRSYLGILYNVLLTFEVVRSNIPYKMEILGTEKKIRETLTNEQRQKIDRELAITNYYFWRSIHIFFHSACRETEFMSIRKSDVELHNHRFKVLTKKGKAGKRWEWRTIKDIASPLWEEVINEAGSNQYLFSVGMQPGEQRIRTEQFGRRWRRHVKQKMNITADLYSLKHSNLDEITELHGLKVAQAAAGHSSEKMTLVYAVGEDRRAHNRIKEAGNKFA